MRLRISYRSAPVEATPKVRRLQEAFGIGLCEHKMVIADLEVELPDKGIVFITGPSGCGKSSLLRLISEKFKDVCDLGRVKLPDVPLVEGLGVNFGEAMRVFGMVGLGEAFVLLRRPKELSDGQCYRAHLAMAIASSPKLIVADEFCSALDRQTAFVVAYNLRRLLWRHPLLLVCAAAQDDILTDLQPDLLIRYHRGQWMVERLQPKPKPISFADRIVIRPGTHKEWKHFARWHYRSHSTGIVDKIFVMELDEEPVGIVVYGHPMGACRLRNIATNKRYAGKPVSAKRSLLDKEVRVVQRIVIDPRFRGLGLAARLLRETIGKLGVRYVECITVMGGYSGFLQKAGFVCVGRVEAPRVGRVLLGTLRKHGFDEHILTSKELLEKALERISVEDGLLWRLVLKWWRGRRFTKGGGEPTPARLASALSNELLSRPFYFICDLKEMKDED